MTGMQIYNDAIPALGIESEMFANDIYQFGIWEVMANVESLLGVKSCKKELREAEIRSVLSSVVFSLLEIRR